MIGLDVARLIVIWPRSASASAPFRPVLGEAACFSPGHNNFCAAEALRLNQGEQFSSVSRGKADAAV